MQNLLVISGMNASYAMELIQDGCRANEKRELCYVGKGKTAVDFKSFCDGTYYATLINIDGEVIASAIIDKFDI